MTNQDSWQEPSLEVISLYLYLLPVVGFFPALWTLYCQKGSREQQKVSRLALTLACLWLVTYILLGLGAENTADLLTLRLSLVNSLVTSGYFLTCLGLMIRLWQRKSVRVPWVTQVAEGLVRKYLS